MRSRKCGQILTVCCPEGGCRTLSRRDSRVFVPEGLNDRSQAIYCLECVQKGAPSRRDGVIGSDRRATIRGDQSTPGKDQTVAYGTDSRLNLFQAINCLDFGELSRVATIS